MNYDEESRRKAFIRMRRQAAYSGWLYISGWKFESPSGTIHDLSGADPMQLDRIENEGLFLVSDEEDE